jgi:hypothetical protein
MNEEKEKNKNIRTDAIINFLVSYGLNIGRIKGEISDDYLAHIIAGIIGPGDYTRAEIDFIQSITDRLRAMAKFADYADKISPETIISLSLHEVKIPRGSTTGMMS